MKFKKPLIKLVAIWSLFFMFSLSFTWVVSLTDEKVNNFWTMKKLDISFADSTYASSGGWEGWYRWGGERERGWWDDGYRRPALAPTPAPAPITNPTTPSNPTIPTPTSNKICKTVYDTVTTASGWTVQEPREVCTTKTVKPKTPKAVAKKPTPKPIKTTKKPVIKKVTKNTNIWLSNAEKTEIKSQFNAIYTKIVALSNTDSEINAILNKISNIITSKIDLIQNRINSLSNSVLRDKYNKQLLILKELDNLVFDKTMWSNIVSSILNTWISFSPIKHVAPIWSTYTIIQTSNWQYSFKRQNWTTTSKTWNTPEAVISYIDKNAVPVANRPTPVAKPKPIVVSKPKPVYKPRPVVKPKPKPVYVAPKPTPKPVAAPAPKPVPVPTTTTTAS